MAGLLDRLTPMAMAAAFLAPAWAEAEAQTAVGVTASVSTQTSGPAATTQSAVCFGNVKLNLLPISHDIPTTHEEFVLVYTRDGKPVSARKITAEDARDMKRYDCRKSAGALVG